MRSTESTHILKNDCDNQIKNPQSTKEMDNHLIRFSELLPPWMYEYFSTVPKVINKLLFLMGFCNIFLLVGVLQATGLPNLGVSPTFLSSLLCAQNTLTWFALNNHRLSSYNRLPTIVANDFVVGCLLGISVGGAIVAFVLSQFFGQMSTCVSIQMTNFEYKCQHQVAMKEIWFWSGLVFWINTILSVTIIFAKDELSYLQHANYETIGLALEELQSNFERNAVYTQSPGDGTFFGSANSAVVGQQPSEYPTTPSQEEALRGIHANNARIGLGGYGVESGFDDARQQAPSEHEREVTRQLSV
jgi:hypothetical protein